MYINHYQTQDNVKQIIIHATQNTATHRITEIIANKVNNRPQTHTLRWGEFCCVWGCHVTMKSEEGFRFCVCVWLCMCVTCPIVSEFNPLGKGAVLFPPQSVQFNPVSQTLKKNKPNSHVSRTARCAIMLIWARSKCLVDQSDCLVGTTCCIIVFL